ncbi:MAG: helix-turn-helix transcriptional regulator [Erythrobacter sp.]|nr:helix-turn-helix transcriptional regulator [Erythrobacter sp.]
MEIVGERWALLIVRELMLGPRRFSGLRASLPGISAKVLTERLAGLEAAGVLEKHRLPAPAYRLTPWGEAAEPMMQELGRWAAMSARHDPTLPLSPVSFMLSLRTMLNRGRAGAWQVQVGFRFPDAAFVAALAKGEMPVVRAEPEDCDVVFTSPGGPSLAALFYGGLAAEEAGVAIAGDADAAARFMGLFELPAKIA